MPTFGMALEAGDARAALQTADRLAPLAPRFVSGYLDTRHDAPEQMLPPSRLWPSALDAPLALEIVVPEAADPTAVLQRIAAAARTAGANPASVAATWAGDLEFVMPGTVFADTSPFDWLYTAARAAFPGYFWAAAALPISPSSIASATLRFARLRLPYDLRNRACRGRPLGDGNDRVSTARHQVGPCIVRKQALSHRPGHDRHADEPIRQRSTAQPKERPRHHGTSRSTPARPPWCCMASGLRRTPMRGRG